MTIGPFTSYAPPGVYTRTVTEPVVTQLLGGIRIPTLIGTAKETLGQTGYEIIRGSSSVADTPVFGEDMTGRAIVSGPNNAPVLGPANGSRAKFKVRNFPIVDGAGYGKVTYDSTKVAATVNGQQVVVSAVDGPNGVITLLVPPQDTDIVSFNYFFHRGDTLITDDVSSQVTVDAAVLVVPKAETYNITLGVSDTLALTVDDVLQVSIKLTAGSSRAASDVANDINAAAITGLTASVHVDAAGLSHVQLQAQGNILIGSGNANGALGLNPGQTTGRKTSFRVFNGPVVDGSGGGTTTTDPSKVVVKVNNAQVLARALDGTNSTVTLPFAPKPGSTVTVSYYFNTWQDTFDYLPNSNITNVGDVGIAPSRRDYINGADFVVINQGDQSIIQWGTAFLVTAGEKTGLTTFDSTQVTGLLVDNRIYGVQCTRYSDPVTSTVSETKFVMPLSPTSGNGRDTPLGSSLYQTVTNSRIDLPTNRPDLVVVYVGKTWRDAASRPAVAVLEVDSASSTFVLKNPVPADYNAYATFWYNRIQDDEFTLSVVASGPSGVGQYTITSKATGAELFGTKFGAKTGLSKTIQWPSGVEYLPDAFHTGSGSPISETVTVTFSTALNPASHASFTNAHQDPYDIYTASRIFGGVVVDGNPAVSVDLSAAYKATLVGNPVTNPIAPLSTDRLVLVIDGVTVGPIDVSAATTLAMAATAINAAIDADVQTHADGSGTFFSTAPNSLASVTTYGTEVLLQIKGRNVKSFTNGLVSSVLVLVPTSSGQTDASFVLGLAPNMSASGSYDALNQVATLVGTKVAPYNITAGLNDNLQVSVDGFDFNVTLPAGAAVSLDDVVTTINDSYLAVAPAADIATYTADVVALANALKSNYNTHIGSTTFHVAADAVNNLTSPNATNLGTAITLLNEMRTKYNLHLVEAGVHQMDDTTNVVSLSACTDLATAVLLAHDLKEKFNLHRVQLGVHGHDDTVNVEATANATDLATTQALANSLKTNINAHLIQGGVHLTNDVTNTIVAANAVDLPTSITLLNQEKANFNAHIASTTYHNVVDTTNTVSTADAIDLPTAIALANAIKAAYNLHRVQLQGGYHVHGRNDATNVVSTSLSELVAHTGTGSIAGQLWLSSRTNSPSSNVGVKTGSTAADVLGFTAGATAGRVQPTASALASALNANAGFGALAISRPVPVSGLGTFLSIISRTTGSTSTLSFTSVANTAFITDTNLGIVPGTSGDVGEAAQAGFTVSSSAGLSGSHGTGFPGQTYTDATTGLRFTILPASSGDYDNGGSFTMVVGQTFTCDATIPIRAIGGVEATVYNTNNMNPGTTAILTTYPKSGAQPTVGDIYYISYEYAKTDMTTNLYRDNKRIQQAFGTPTPENPLSLGARFALLNGAVLLGLKQVPKASGSSQATVASYVAAIDEQKKPISGSVKPDVIVPLATDPEIFSYLNQHCVFMSSPRQEGERIGIIGTAVGTSPLGVQAIAKGLASELMVLMYPDSFVVTLTDDSGNTLDQLVDGSYAAAALAGSTCNPSIDVATPITRRSIAGFKSLGRVLDPTEANSTAVAGVTIVEQVDTGLRIRHGLTTNVQTVITRTPSVTLTIQFVQQTVRRVLDPYIGQKYTGAIIKSVENQLTGAFGNLIDQTIVNKLGGMSVYPDTQDPTILRTESIYMPVFPLEYIVSTLQVRMRL